jgi:hypothetical protein
MDADTTEQLYCGYDNESKLSLNGCIFRSAQCLNLVSPGETGGGWSKAEIYDLADRLRASIECDPGVLDDLPHDVRDELLTRLLSNFPKVRNREITP